MSAAYAIRNNDGPGFAHCGCACRTSYHQEWGGCVADYMSKEVTTIASGTDIIKAADMFMNSTFRRFPILENGRLTGQISRADILRALEDHWADVELLSR